MSPETFREYWGLSNEELALLTGYSLDSVNHWFATGSSKRQVPPAAKLLLATIHSLWLSWEAEDLPPQIEEICRLVEKRKEEI